MNDQQYRFIRGARILQQLNEESTYNDLVTNITTSFPTTRKRQHATNEVNIQHIDIVPYLGTKMMHVRAISNGSTGQQYQQAIQFLNVVFNQTKTPENVEFIASDGKTYYVMPVDLNNHNVKVRCNCLDFYHRFAHWNHADRSIVGRAPVPYQRKTTTRPEVNPDHVPGMCKHLLKVVQDLQRRGIVT